MLRSLARSFTLQAAFVAFADTNGNVPQNSDAGGLGVWTATAEPTSSSQWPYPAQLDNGNGLEYLIFALLEPPARRR